MRPPQGCFSGDWRVSRHATLPIVTDCSNSLPTCSASRQHDLATAASRPRSWLIVNQSERSARLLVRALYYATEGEPHWWVVPQRRSSRVREGHTTKETTDLRRFCLGRFHISGFAGHGRPPFLPDLLILR